MCSRWHAAHETSIWVVRVGDELYVRSWRGTEGAWFRAAQRRRRGHVRAGGVERDIEFIDAGSAIDDVVDAGFRTKYARYPSYVEPMISARARATTLKLVPRDGA